MKAMELFCCSGGMAAGFREAGVTFDLAFDFDNDACDSYAANLGHRPVQMDVRDLLRMVRGGWSPGPIDLLVADPPCTPWSRAGKRKGEADERDMMGPTVELITLLRPRAYLIGNVPGLQDSTTWPVVQRLIGGLARQGYCAADYACLDAADYGVPQHRVRPFWFGHLNGPCITWPTRTHGPAEGRQVLVPGTELLPWRTCRDALGHLPAEQLGRPVRLRWRSDCHPPSAWNRPGNVVPSSQPGNGGALLANAKHPVNELDKIAAAGEHAGHLSPNAIVLSELAAKILQGFPESWTFAGKTKRARWAQLGMAMPPALAAAVARSIVRQMAAARSSAP